MYDTSTKNIKVFIDITEIPDLIKYSVKEDTLVLGANISLNKTISIFYKMANDPSFSYLKKMADHIDLVAHVAVRNVCTKKSKI